MISHDTQLCLTELGGGEKMERGEEGRVGGIKKKKGYRWKKWVTKREKRGLKPRQTKQLFLSEDAAIYQSRYNAKFTHRGKNTGTTKQWTCSLLMLAYYATKGWLFLHSNFLLTLTNLIQQLKGAGSAGCVATTGPRFRASHAIRAPLSPPAERRSR